MPVQLQEVPHPVIRYAVMGDATDNPFLSILVTALVIDDGGRPTMLLYRPPRRAPEWKPLGKALAKLAGGVAAGAWVTRGNSSPLEATAIQNQLTGLAGRWAEADLERAFGAHRGEGYYSVQPAKKYYDGPIHAL